MPGPGIGSPRRNNPPAVNIECLEDRQLLSGMGLGSLFPSLVAAVENIPVTAALVQTASQASGHGPENRSFANLGPVSQVSESVSSPAIQVNKWSSVTEMLLLGGHRPLPESGNPSEAAADPGKSNPHPGASEPEAGTVIPGLSSVFKLHGIAATPAPAAVPIHPLEVQSHPDFPAHNFPPEREAHLDVEGRPASPLPEVDSNHPLEVQSRPDLPAHGSPRDSEAREDNERRPDSPLSPEARSGDRHLAKCLPLLLASTDGARPEDADADTQPQAARNLAALDSVRPAGQERGGYHGASEPPGRGDGFGWYGAGAAAAGAEEALVGDGLGDAAVFETYDLAQRPPGPLAAFTPERPGSLDLALRQFLDQAEELGQDLGRALPQSALAPWVLALTTAAATLELTRRRLRRTGPRLGPAGDGEDVPSTLLAGLPGSFTTEDL